MFKKQERLSRAEFSHYFAQGRRTHDRYTTIIYVPHPERKTAVVVGKKVAKQAVRRNTLRRRAYAILRAVLEETQATGVYIVILKPAIRDLSRRDAATALRQALMTVIAAAEKTS